MKVRDPTLWMWGEALELLERADRLQRQFCQLGPNRRASPTWEPPVDLFETDQQFVIVLALPGVTPGQLDIQIEAGAIVVRGQRRLPAAGQRAQIHRLELPYGYFERRIELPQRLLTIGARSLSDGCLTLTLNKIEAAT